MIGILFSDLRKCLHSRHCMSLARNLVHAQRLAVYGGELELPTDEEGVEHDQTHHQQIVLTTLHHLQ